MSVQFRFLIFELHQIANEMSKKRIRNESTNQTLELPKRTDEQSQCFNYLLLLVDLLPFAGCALFCSFIHPLATPPLHQKCDATQNVLSIEIINKLLSIIWWNNKQNHLKQLIGHWAKSAMCIVYIWIYGMWCVWRSMYDNMSRMTSKNDMHDWKVDDDTMIHSRYEWKLPTISILSISPEYTANSLNLFTPLLRMFHCMFNIYRFYCKIFTKYHPHLDATQIWQFCEWYVFSASIWLSQTAITCPLCIPEMSNIGDFGSQSIFVLN